MFRRGNENMTINSAPSVTSDLVKPMEDVSEKGKEFFTSLLLAIKSITFFFGILFAPIIVFLLIFHFEIYSLFFDKQGLYNSSIITSTTALFLCYWLYKSALFANKGNENFSKVIYDNMISLFTLVFLIYDISTNLFQYKLGNGLTQEQFYSEKWLIITIVAIDFILGLRSGYLYYKENHSVTTEVDEAIDAEFSEVSDIENIDDKDSSIQNEDEVNENESTYDNKKMSKYLMWSVIVFIVIGSVFYIFNGS